MTPSLVKAFRHFTEKSRFWAVFNMEAVYLAKYFFYGIDYLQCQMKHY